ncbi:hypothetical protein [Flavobacterium sp.]|uniref:hypothetical protein n=1 Tax=Flavobacterium sp. TaxID=239 RepID=UPI0039E51F40
MTVKETDLSKIDNWSKISDFFGGIINTIISLFSLIILAIITLIVANQANSENKKTNLLLKRIESYDRLSQFVPKLILAVQEIKVVTTHILHKLKNKDSANLEIEIFGQHSRVMTEIFSSIATFELQYGHLYKYDFNCNDFENLVDLSQKINENFNAIREKFILGQTDFPLIDAKQMTEFVMLFNKILKNLKTELR